MEDKRVTRNLVPFPARATGESAVGDPNATPVNLPDAIPQMEIGNLGFEDIGAAFNMRGWLQKACEAAGGKMTGGGFGGGVADIDIELEGHTYNIATKALKR